ncbi:hypothetical protein BOW53_04290 [Solemya pervernicosa gill symbiont]|uniref:PilY1 beta-propeller domain-containing protein n=2 Tax=Gammaproteobacteria incertae sedis TaxID=118884 RepID=A0A1T2L8D3_9GAMM|nr:PilC/PilY family type IV pilus protein [Candidatus Reidiella endopervernicosa]OOZ41341.1 hypothetical protein BOW53_04290 [Solemya pervernicosa gill symbiont]QKQ27720.1 hypothetical protein HUE57_16580 [Candidatus Reidiella endopervernicosa]
MNRETNPTTKPILRKLTIALFSCLSASVQAAPGTLDNSPLFLGNSIQPNILFMIDDSGSMGWADLLNEGTPYPGSAYLTDHTYYQPPSGIYGSWWDRVFRRLSCRGVNLMAYDPSVTYTPWHGDDNSGNAYVDQTLASARDNPYSTTTSNISDHYYWVWNDADGDGEYDGPASSDIGAAANSSTDECGDVGSNSGGVAVNSLSAALQTNYANWYSFYRKREYVMKRALSQIIDESTSRMGLMTINNDSDVATPVKDIDDVTTPVDTTAQSNKTALLDNLFDVSPSGGTPLRTGLERAGKYFDGDYSGSWASPILSASNGGTCQQNFTALMSDGYWNGSDPSVGDADSDDDTSYDGGSHADGDTSSTISNTLADVAMEYYENDLSTIANEVPTTIGVDENATQHMVTYTVAFGLNGQLDSDPTDRTTAFNWPTPTADAITTTDDMRHAAWNSRGKFLNASDPQGLITAFNDAISDIADRTGSAAAVTFNTGSLEADSVIYLSLFNSSKWSSQLLAYPLNTTTGAIGSTASWDAANLLDNRDISASPRTLLTFNSDSGTNDGVAFQWSNLTTAQKNDLKTNSSGGSDSDTIAQARLNHLRGERSNEGSGYNFRVRNSRLGDIIHSAPTYVAEPDSDWPDTAPFPDTSSAKYSVFQASKASRTGVIYAGGNDGMLHGFSTEGSNTGEEVLAYIPSNLFSTTTTAGLHYLTDPDYLHRYYVDLTPTISDAYVKTTSTGSADWATVLIGGERAGGRGLFALDVTDPSQFSESNASDLVMWEFDENDDADLGYTFSQPTIALLNNDRWAAIFGNGYNDSGAGEAQLFILFLDGGLDGTWTDGSGSSDLDYIKISTDVGSSGSKNGLATPAVIDTDGDGTADRVYAGDLEGNMWAFDLSASNTNSWDVAYKQGNTPKPLFTARDSSGNTQPITVTPTILKNPSVDDTTQNSPNVMVLFGTGQYLVDTDKTSSGTQSFYAVWDEGTDELLRTNLQEQTLLSGFPADVRVPSNNTIAFDGSGSAQQFGWYLDLPDTGERVITDAVARGDIIYFNTTVPTSDPCSYGGYGWQMSIKIDNGGRPDSPVFDYNDDGYIDNNDTVDQDPNEGSLTDESPGGEKFTKGLPTSPSFLGDHQYTAGTGGSNDGGAPPVEERDVEHLGGDLTGRLSWEELSL